MRKSANGRRNMPQNGLVYRSKLTWLEGCRTMFGVIDGPHLGFFKYQGRYFIMKGFKLFAAAAAATVVASTASAGTLDDVRALYECTKEDGFLNMLFGIENDSA